MDGPILRRYTREQYLALEESTVVRHELVDGLIQMMAGGTRWHDQLASSSGTPST